MFIILFFIFFCMFEHFHNEKPKNPILLNPETRSISKDRMFVALR